jgi:hypothetical protein
MIILLSAIFVLFVGARKKEISTEEALKAFSGTWVNEDYNPSRIYAKVIFQSDGKVYWFLTTTMSTVGISAEFTIEDAWIDSKGNIWCKVIEESTLYMTQFSLIRISDSGKTIEWTQSSIDYPKKIVTNPEDITSRYRIYYRQE